VATPSVQVELRGLTVTTEAVVGSAGIPTAANFALRLAKVGVVVAPGPSGKSAESVLASANQPHTPCWQQCQRSHPAPHAVLCRPRWAGRVTHSS
jgi:hypothetical protein